MKDPIKIKRQAIVAVITTVAIAITSSMIPDAATLFRQHYDPTMTQSQCECLIFALHCFVWWGILTWAYD